MAERRTLAATMTTTVPGIDEELVRSFVTQNQTSERPVATPRPPGDAKRTHVREAEAIEPPTTDSKAAKPNRLQPVGLIPVTVRLRPEIAGALKRASLERELEGAEVFTQQDIVEHALEPWLRREGVLG